MLIPGGKGLEVDAELVVGDKTQSVDTQAGDRVSQAATTINNANDIPFTYILLFTLLAGVAIPSFGEMGRGLMGFLKLLIPWSK